MSTAANLGTKTAQRDVFLCYASEERKDVVEPIYRALTGAGITCWYDEEEIQAGDLIAGKINEGLKVTRYVIVVLSLNFLKKHYPVFELMMSINGEASTGHVKVIPLLCGTESQREDIHSQLPILGGVRCLSWNDDPQEVVDALRKRLSTSAAALAAGASGRIPPLATGGRRRRYKSRVTLLLLLMAVTIALAALLPRFLDGQASVNYWRGGMQEDYLPEMVLIEGGAFPMGMSADEARQLRDEYHESDATLFEDSTPTRDVYVDAFYISRTEVTNGQYEQFLAGNPGRARGPASDTNKPVTMVSLLDAKAYCEWISKKTGKKYRLPTEAEWEKAANGGGVRRFPWGDDQANSEHANFRKSGVCTAPVGSRPQGATPDTGLLDMAGNVAEWCNDWYDLAYYKSGESKKPKGPVKGERKIVRGGSCGDTVYLLHCAVRNSYPPETRREDLGFRVVKEF